jgi:hypothetical protein
MSTQVPDGNTLIPTDQIHTLLNTLERKPAFARQRGNLPGLAVYLRTVAETQHTPAATRKFLENLGIRGDVGQLATLIAQLYRDKHHTALEALIWSLEDPNYVFSGETVPADARTNLAVCLPHPKLTLTILEAIWYHPYGVFEYAYCYEDEVFQQLRALLPSGLGRQIARDRKRYGRYHNTLRTVLEHLRGFTQSSDTWPTCHSIAKKSAGLFLGPNDQYPLQREYVMTATPVMAQECMNPNIAFACYGLTTQGRMLGSITPSRPDRTEKRRVLREQFASWQFKVPSRFLARHPHAFSIGFHPEREHEMWKKRCPSFVSKSTNKGWGAIILHPDVMDRYRAKRDDTSQPFRAILHAPCSLHAEIDPECFDTP